MQWPEVNFSGRAGGKASGSQGSSPVWCCRRRGSSTSGVGCATARPAADAQYASAQADQRAARQAIVAALAKAWFLAGESMLQKRLITDVLSASETIVRLAEDRLRFGVGAEADVALARADLQTYRDTALQIDFALAQSRRALEVLLGRYPAAEIELPTGLIAMPPPVTTGVPSDLLERRPDIVAAERRFAASFARVGEARAARLPKISLSAALSSLSSNTFVLKTDSDPSVGGSVALFFPIFNAGQLEAQVELRTAEQKQAGAAYAQTGAQGLQRSRDRAGERVVARRPRAGAAPGPERQPPRARAGAGPLSGRLEGPAQRHPAAARRLRREHVAAPGADRAAGAARAACTWRSEATSRRRTADDKHNRASS